MQRECGPMKPQKKQQQMRCRSSTDGQQNTETILFQQYQEDQDSLLPLRTKKNVKPSEQPSIKNLLLSLPPLKLTYHVNKITKSSSRKSLIQRFRKLSLHQAQTQLLVPARLTTLYSNGPDHMWEMR